MNNESTVILIKSKLIDDKISQHDLNPALKIIQSLVVWLVKGEETVNCSTTDRPRKLIWNIFFKQPPHLM